MSETIGDRLKRVDDALILIAASAATLHGMDDHEIEVKCLPTPLSSAEIIESITVAAHEAHQELYRATDGQAAVLKTPSPEL